MLEKRKNKKVKEELVKELSVLRTSVKFDLACLKGLSDDYKINKMDMDEEMKAAIKLQINSLRHYILENSEMIKLIEIKLEELN